MNTQIIFADALFERLKTHLLRDPNQEQAAFLLAGRRVSERGMALLVRRMIEVTPDGFLAQGGLFLSLNPDFTNRVLKEAGDLSVILVHSHPFESARLFYSEVDNDGESKLFRCFHTRLPGRVHASLLFGPAGVIGRVWNASGTACLPISEVRVIGERIRRFRPDDPERPRLDQVDLEVHDRQVRAFGEQGHAAIRAVRVAVVGAGGTGSIVVEQLAHLGVGELVVIDDDRVETSNRARIVGSRPEDAADGRPKIEVLRRLVAGIDPTVRFEGIDGNVCDDGVARALRDVDVILCCTDTHWSRAVLNQIAFQYLVPVVDLGVKIVTTDARTIRSAGGKVNVLRPDGVCLWCSDDINATVINHESLGPEERARQIAEGYITGAEVHNPAVIALNGVVSSLAVLELLNLLTGFMVGVRGTSRLVYKVLEGRVAPAGSVRKPECIVCGLKGVIARGDLEGLPVCSTADQP